MHKNMFSNFFLYPIGHLTHPPPSKVFLEFYFIYMAPCLSQFAIPGRDGPVIIEQRHQSWLLSKEAGERIKANWEIEKPTSTNIEVQSGHLTASCMLGAAWWSPAWATRREKVMPMHDGKALSWRPNWKNCRSPVCPRCLFFAYSIVVWR